MQLIAQIAFGYIIGSFMVDAINTLIKALLIRHIRKNYEIIEQKEETNQEQQ